VLTLAYRCSEENIGEEYWSDFEEFKGMRIPQSLCLWKLKKELLVLVIILCSDLRVHPSECNK
jgi:hypothetical protein